MPLTDRYGRMDQPVGRKMQRTGLRTLRLLTACIWLAPGTAVLALHDQGVASCRVCHTMHNSQDGFLVDPENPTGNPWLLKSGTPSDLCLSCHGAVFGDNPLAPPPEKGAGNFVFLLEDNINDAPGGATNPIPGCVAGHSINAPSRGVGPDLYWPAAPGGTFPSDQLGCTSCHDPHGNDNFRHLHGVGPVQNGIAYFVNPAPQAEGIALSPQAGAESNSNHSAYRAGMNEWCANCHGRYHDEPGGSFQHDFADHISGWVMRHYNEYNGADDPTGGSYETAYLAEVPFEDEDNTVNSTQGPFGYTLVLCQSCHRAHASSAPHAGRWDFYVAFLQEDGVESGSYPIPDPYHSPNQDSLCNKCHGID